MAEPTVEMLRRMALENPDLAARYAASTGVAPPKQLVGALPAQGVGQALGGIPTPMPRPAGPMPGPTPVPMPKPTPPAQAAPAAQPNIGAALAGVQGLQAMGQGPAPLTGTAGYSGGRDGNRLLLELLLAGQNRSSQPTAPNNLAAFLPGMR